MRSQKHSADSAFYKQTALRNTFRQLWEQHVMWTREYIISNAMNLPDENLVAKRLLRNPTDFAKELSVFYGAETANKFADLLRQHLLIASDLINAAKAGNPSAIEEERTKWYRNADEIAAFLAGINPYWNRQEWKAMLYDHLRLTEEEALQRLNGQYAADIVQYDLIENEALQMADMMSSGIIRQFPL